MTASSTISNINRLTANRLAAISGTEAYPTQDYANLVSTYYFSQLLSGTDATIKTLSTATGTVATSGDNTVLDTTTLFPLHLSGNTIVITALRIQNEAATGNTVILKNGDGTAISRVYMKTDGSGIDRVYEAGRELRIKTTVSNSVLWSNTILSPATVDNTGTYTVRLSGGDIVGNIDATFETDGTATRAELNAGLLAAIVASDMADYVTAVLATNTITLTAKSYSQDYALTCTTNGTTTNDLTIGTETAAVTSGSLMLNLSAATTVGYSIEYFVES
jgi:hypothetical protein